MTANSSKVLFTNVLKPLRPRIIRSGHELNNRVITFITFSNTPLEIFLTIRAIKQLEVILGAMTFRRKTLNRVALSRMTLCIFALR